MGATCGAGSAYPSGAPEITPVFGGVRVAKSRVFYVVCTIICLFVFLFLAMTLSVYFLSMSLTIPLVSFAPLLREKYKNRNTELQLNIGTESL